MTGLMATCLQHEMDHLEGVLFVDHLSRLKRDAILRKLQKARRQSARPRMQLCKAYNVNTSWTADM